MLTREGINITYDQLDVNVTIEPEPNSSEPVNVMPTVSHDIMNRFNMLQSLVYYQHARSRFVINVHDGQGGVDNPVVYHTRLEWDPVQGRWDHQRQDPTSLVWEPREVAES
jgi:hypothetical protein